MDLCKECKVNGAQNFCVCNKSLIMCIYCAEDHKKRPGVHFLIDIEDLSRDNKLYEASQAANSLEEIKSLLMQEGKEITGEIFEIINNSIKILDIRIKKIAELTQKKLPFDEFEGKLRELMTIERLLTFKTLVRDSLRSHFGLDYKNEMPFVYKELKLLREEVQRGNSLLETLVNNNKAVKKDLKVAEFERKIEKTEEKVGEIEKQIKAINKYLHDNNEGNLKLELKTLKTKLEELEKEGGNEIIEILNRFEPIEQGFLSV